MLRRRAVLGAAVASVLLTLAVSDAEATQPVLIGGGAAGDVYDHAARQVCRLVNEHAGDRYGCLARTAPGSAFNIRAVELGLMEFGLARPGAIREAVTGKGMWRGQPSERLRAVFGLTSEAAVLVTSADVTEDLVYDVVRTVFENLDALRGAHPALRGLDPAAMLGGLSAPIHPGAARYYQERGWL